MEYLYQEKQKFNQWWLWITLCVFPILSLIPFDNSGINYNYVLIGFGIPLLFYFLEFRIYVTHEKIYYQFYPIHLKKKVIKIKDIIKIEPVKYKPILEYGGWGIRYTFSGKAYNVKGNLGVKLHLKNQRHILFGSQNHNQLGAVLQKLLNNN